MKEISAKQERLIASLLTTRTVEDACRNAKVSSVTYWRWMKQERFVRAYRQSRRSILEDTVGKLQALSSDAIEALRRNLRCEIPSVELRAAQIILEQSFKGFEALGVEERIDLLEILVERLETELEKSSLPR